MAEEKVLRFRRLAAKLQSKYEELRNTIPTPFIIVMKGDPATGRKLAAFLAASILKCPLIKKQDFDNYEEETEENQATVWRKICKLASSQLKSGSSVIIDTELANRNEFDILKELSEIHIILLVVFECRVDDAYELWEDRDNFEESTDTIGPIAFEFLEKPTSQYIYRTIYNMGEILKIPVEMNSTSRFNALVPYALKDLRDHIDPNFESEEINNCGHYFLFKTDDDYQRRCWKCRQLVSGSFYRCYFCRLIFHRTCCYFPESLLLQNLPFHDVTLNLRYVVPELDDEATCSCCKNLLIGRYYCNEDGLVFFDLDCLFSLPAKRKTKLHQHELLRAFYEEHWCMECRAIIGRNTIFYYCDMCHMFFDVYCLLLPETAHFDRHRHPFKLSIVPRVDSLPYYCEVCQEERNTERWIYYCAECDYPIHPRCIVEDSCLLRSLSTQISISNKKSKEVLTGSEFQGCSSHLSSERVRVTELPRQHRFDAKELHLLFKESLEEIELPILIQTKGNSDIGRKLVTLALATTLDCLLIDKDNLCEVTNITNEPKQDCYQEFSSVVLSQLQLGLSVVIDLDLSHESEFISLRDLAIAIETPLIIVECKLCDEGTLEDFDKISNLRSDYEYDVCDTPKLLLNITTPTCDGIKELMPHILHSISAYSKWWRKRHSKESDTPNCYIHTIPFGLEYDVSEGKICNRCSKQLSTPVLKCQNCALVLHKQCTKLPLRIRNKSWTLILKQYVDNKNKFRCDCCNAFVKDYAYTSSGINYGEDFNCLICLDCLFTTPRPKINLHEHPMQLRLQGYRLECDACGYVSKQKLRYTCKSKNCDYEIGVKCGLLKETVPFDRHRHPFHLLISPEHVSNQYYCEVCGEERDKKHWVYCCAECDYYIHVRCLLPTGGCRPLES